MYIASEYDYELFITRTAVRIRQYGKWIFDVVVDGENFDLKKVTVRTTKTARLSCLENFLKNELPRLFKVRREDFLPLIMQHVIAVDWVHGYER